MPNKRPIPQQVSEFLSSRIRPPSLVQNPETGAPFLEPAVYAFRAPYTEEFERIARAAAEASGIVPSIEDLNAQAMAMMEQSKEQA